MQQNFNLHINTAINNKTLANKLINITLQKQIQHQLAHLHNQYLHLLAIYILPVNVLGMYLTVSTEKLVLHGAMPITGQVQLKQRVTQ